jgi:hypothetical protein
MFTSSKLQIGQLRGHNTYLPAPPGTNTEAPIEELVREAQAAPG